jgi:AcrR family transcriptional regulator
MDAIQTKQKRGEPLITKVLEAALEEIARVGPEDLSIEEVAARAGVNKTTIWRRWQTPAALALSALQRVSDTSDFANHGTLRDDLIDYVRRFREVCRSPAMLSVVRMKFRGKSEGPLGGTLTERFARADDEALVMFHRAIERGELPADTDVALLRDMVLGIANYLILFRYDWLQDTNIDRVVDIFLVGPVGRAVSG